MTRALLVGVAGLLWTGCGDPTGPEPARLIFSAPPEHVLVGEPMSEVRVTGVDEVDEVVRGASGRVRLALAESPSGTGLVGTTEVPLVSGTAFFHDLRVDGPARDVRLEARMGTGTAAATSAPFDVVETPDLIRVHNVGGLPLGVLADGGGGGRFVNDRPFVVQDSSVELILDRATESNELTVFSRGRAPTLVLGAPWTSDADTVDVRLRDPVSVNANVWILAGEEDVQRSKAEAAARRMGDIWEREGTGLELGAVEIDDLSDDPDLPESGVSDWVCDLADEAPEELAELLAYRPGEINAYVVESVDVGPEVLGHACGPGTVVLRVDHEASILAHEVGHLFGLPHPQELDSPVGEDNLMNSSQGVYLTEAQVFWMHYERDSQIDESFGQPVGVSRICYLTGLVQTVRCPPHHLRLFPDGENPRNWY